MIDYHPFGMLMPGRRISSSDYRFGFNGQENDKEIKGDGNSLSFKYRIHDSRLGRFLSVDPLEKKYAFNSPYSFAENKLGIGKELEGLEVTIFFGNNTTLVAPKGWLETMTKATDVVTKTSESIPGPGPWLPGYIKETVPRTPPTVDKPEVFNENPTAPVDQTASPPIEIPTEPLFEARKAPQSEAEQEEAAENQKLDRLKEVLDKKQAGQTKENTQGQEKELGQQQEEIDKAQNTNRKQGKPNQIESTKKSEQKTDNELNDFKNEYNNNKK